MNERQGKINNSLNRKQQKKNEKTTDKNKTEIKFSLPALIPVSHSSARLENQG